VDPDYSEKIGKDPFLQRPMIKAFLTTIENLGKTRATANHLCKETPKLTPKPMQLPTTKLPDIQNKYTFEMMGIKISFEWGRMLLDESVLKKLSSGETKGSAVSSKNPPHDSNVSLQEILDGHGPLFNQNIIEQTLYNGPLISDIPDDADSTRRYVEFDKYGNFSDLKIALNADGTRFADKGKENFDERRWCWIACPSGREKILAGLSKKKQ
jgi:hypothetical protein